VERDLQMVAVEGKLAQRYEDYLPRADGYDLAAAPT
jgi:hypothetical protein